MANSDWNAISGGAVTAPRTRANVMPASFKLFTSTTDTVWGTRASAERGGSVDSAGAGVGPKLREASIGITVSATISETTSENVTVSAWSPNSCPATPSTNTIGTKTQIVVRVLAITARDTPPAPSRAAFRSSRP